MIKIKLYSCGIRGNSEYTLGLGYLKSNCKNANIEIVLNKEELKDCDLIGLSVASYGIKESIEILNNTNIPIVIGGHGVLWKEINNYNFKHIVMGEGEIALDKIIKGTSEKIVRESLIENLNTLNFPFRGKCGMTVPITTSRGCPFNCNFCCIPPFWEKYRYVSPEYFIEEVKQILVDYPQIKTLYIVDDLFIFNKVRFNKIYELWMKELLNKRLIIRGFVRTDILTLNVAQKMKEMGFKKIVIGIESGSDRILKLLNKNTTVAINQKAINIANKIGLIIQGSFMYNIPEETEEDLKLTYEFIEKNKGKLTVGSWNKFKSFPGTKFYNGENLLDIDMRLTSQVLGHTEKDKEKESICVYQTKEWV